MYFITELFVCQTAVMAAPNIPQTAVVASMIPRTKIYSKEVLVLHFSGAIKHFDTWYHEKLPILIDPEKMDVTEMIMHS